MGILVEIFGRAIYSEDKKIKGDTLLPKPKEANPVAKPSPFLRKYKSLDIGINTPKLLQKTKYKVKIVDGNKYRNHKETVDFGDISIHEDFPNLIPKDEIWIDKEVSTENRKFLIRGAEARLEALARGVDDSDAYDHGLTIERIERIKDNWTEFKNEVKPKGLVEYEGPELSGPLGKIQVLFVNKEKVCNLYKTDCLDEKR